MDEAALREHVVTDPHLMKPEAATSYDLTELTDWHARDHSIAGIERHHSHKES